MRLPTRWSPSRAGPWCQRGVVAGDPRPPPTTAGGDRPAFLRRPERVAGGGHPPLLDQGPQPARGASDEDPPHTNGRRSVMNDIESSIRDTFRGHEGDAPAFDLADARQIAGRTRRRRDPERSRCRPRRPRRRGRAHRRARRCWCTPFETPPRSTHPHRPHRWSSRRSARRFTRSRSATRPDGRSGPRPSPGAEADSPSTPPTSTSSSTRHSGTISTSPWSRSPSAACRRRTGSTTRGARGSAPRRRERPRVDTGSTARGGTGR